MMMMGRCSLALFFAIGMSSAMAGQAAPEARTDGGDSARAEAQRSCGVAPSATMEQIRDFDAKYSADYAQYGDETPPADAKRVDAAFRSRPAARYPATLAGTGTVGRVMLMIAISKDGKVADSAVICSNHPDFAASAINSLKSARFKPQKNDGIGVGSTGFLPFTFIER
jgi:TonB family protein